MIIFEWIYNYINTPQVNMTRQIEILGTLGISICILSVLAIIYIIAFASIFIKKKTKKHKK